MYTYNRPAVRTLTNDDLRKYAASVFASTPHEKMSGSYRFIPTIEVVERMRDHGFQVVRANQSRTSIPGMRDFVKHMLRFRGEEYLNRPLKPGDSIPEILLTNSHNGGSAYRLDSGIFEVICANGLVIKSDDFGSIRVRHSGEIDLTKRVIDATFQIVEDTPKMMSRISDMKALTLTADQQTAFAIAANELLPTPVAPATLLQARRYEDRPTANGERSLWKTYNTVQEHILTGGDRTVGKTGRVRRTRAIKAVDRDIKTNKALYVLAEQMAKLVN